MSCSDAACATERSGGKPADGARGPGGTGGGTGPQPRGYLQSP